VTTLDGTKLEIVPSKQKTMVANAELVRPDIYASNGVLHLVTSLLMSPKSLKLTPEKYLLALNCTSFVSMIHSVDLTSLINDTEAKYTILAPRDDVLSLFGGDELPERGTEELRILLQYHFLPGKWLPKKLKDGMLVETALEEPGLAGRKQVLGVEVHDENKKPTPGRRITFAGAGVLDDPSRSHTFCNRSITYSVASQSRSTTP
jgi:solute carrier family 25 (mitochondrial carnitine/acylcarnitine transporter), member 20/29